MQMVRYLVRSGSQSGHCCFEATVVDSHRPAEFVEGGFRAVCECLDLPDAERIAAALNKAEEQS